MWGIDDIAGLLSTAGEFFRSIISVELEPRHRLFLSIGVKLVGLSLLLLFVLALIQDLTSATPNLSFLVAGGTLVLGFLLLVIGLVDGRDAEKIQSQRRQERLEQEQAETERAWAETEIYQKGRDTLEGRENIVLRMRSGDRDLQVDTQVETQSFQPPVEDDNDSENENREGERSQEIGQGSRDLEEND